MRNPTRRPTEAPKVLSSQAIPPNNSFSLRFTVLGLQLAIVQLDLGESVCQSSGPIDRAVKGMSKWWTERMTS